MTKSKWVGVIAIRTETTQIDFLSDVLVAVASLDLKVPIFSYLRVPRVPFFHLIPVVYSQENRLFPFSGTRLLRPVYPLKGHSFRIGATLLLLLQAYQIV